MTGQGGPGLERLAAAHPGWRIFANRDGIWCGWLVGTSPPLVLHAESVAAIGEEIEAYEAGGNDAS